MYGGQQPYQSHVSSVHIPIRHDGAQNQQQQQQEQQQQQQQQPPPPPQQNYQSSPKVVNKEAAAAPSTYQSSPVINKRNLDAQHLAPGSRDHSRSATPTANLSPLERIAYIMQDNADWERRVQTFAGQAKDNEYRLLEEMLTRNLLKLDDIDACGDDEIRQSRKAAVRTIQAILDQLELKAAANASPAPSETNPNAEKIRQNPAEPAAPPVANHTNNGQAGKAAPDPAKVNEMVLESEIKC